VKAQPIRVATLALSSLAFLSACDAPPREPAAARPAPVVVDACRLFTMEDALAAAGESLSGRMTSTLDDASGRPDPMRCLYNVGTTADQRLVGLEVRSLSSPEEAASALENNRSLLTSLTRGQVQDVTGLGDAALWAGGSVGQLHVATGTFHLILTVQTRSGKELERAKAAAAKVMAQLPAGKT
jgi:hypothetical protein